MMPDASSAVHVRLAQACDVRLLNEIAYRSKASWGYASAQMEAWRAELAISPAWISMQRVHVALVDDNVVGLYVLLDEAGEWRLDHLWVDPSAIGRGVGRALIGSACRNARSLGAVELIVHADPNAEGFYKACGAELIGAIPSPIAHAPARALPLFRLRTEVNKDATWA